MRENNGETLDELIKLGGHIIMSIYEVFANTAVHPSVLFYPRAESLVGVAVVFDIVTQ